MIGVVIIGRNEGVRLIRCLQSIPSDTTVVYVDSGSTDDSIANAKATGATVVELDLSIPFTAARARNAGFSRMREILPNIEMVQFVDGDCEIVSGWIELGSRFLTSRPDIALVCGRRKEMYPASTIFNELCDIEWDTPIGETFSCGGDFIIRVKAFLDVDGFNNHLIAGEEPDLCYRLRKLNWVIYRADHLMTRHDAAISTLGQWSKRAMRSGYAYAARAYLHFGDFTGYCWRENIRISLWACFLPIAAIWASIFSSPWFLSLFLIYPIRFLRSLYRTRATHVNANARAYAFFLILGNWPEFIGQCLFLARLVAGRRQAIIEYK